MDGGHKRWPRARQLQEPPAPPQPQTMRHSRSFMDAPPPSCTLELAHGPAHRRERREGLPDRDHAEHRHLPEPVRLPPKARVGVERARPCHLRRSSAALAGRRRATSAPLPLHQGATPMTSCRRAKSRPSTPSPPPTSGAAGRGSRGPDRHPDDGAPYICPYNVNSIMNPILVACSGSATSSTSTATSRWWRGRRPHLEAPTPWEFDRPSTRATSTSSSRCSPKPPTRCSCTAVRGLLRQRPWYIHLYRTGHAYHGCTPSTCVLVRARTRAPRRVIIVGATRSSARLGFSPPAPRRRTRDGT